MVWRGSAASHDLIENPQLLDAYYNTTDGCSYIYNGENGWQLLARKGDKGETGEQGEKGDKGNDGTNGTNGTDGQDGVSVVWLGAFSSAESIENPVYLNIYYNTTDGCSYIYDGTAWKLLAKAGRNGTAGGFDNLIELSVSATEPTNQDVIITANVFFSNIAKIGYIRSAQSFGETLGIQVVNNENFTEMQITDDGTYTVTAEQNGYYIFGAKTTNGTYIASSEINIANIDKTPTSNISGFVVRYDYSTSCFTLTWTNPTDEDFAYSLLSYSVNGTHVDDLRITDESYVLENCS